MFVFIYKNKHGTLVERECADSAMCFIIIAELVKDSIDFILDYTSF